MHDFLTTQTKQHPPNKFSCEKNYILNRQHKIFALFTFLPHASHHVLWGVSKLVDHWGEPEAGTGEKTLVTQTPRCGAAAVAKQRVNRFISVLHTLPPFAKNSELSYFYDLVFLFFREKLYTVLPCSNSCFFWTSMDGPLACGTYNKNLHFLE